MVHSEPPNYRILTYKNRKWTCRVDWLSPIDSTPVVLLFKWPQMITIVVDLTQHDLIQHDAVGCVQTIHTNTNYNLPKYCIKQNQDMLLQSNYKAITDFIFSDRSYKNLTPRYYYY